MHASWMDISPTISETVSVETIDVETVLFGILKNCDGVVPSFEKKFDCLCAELSRVEPIKQNWATATLCVADFPSENGFSRRVAPAIELKVAVANHLDHLRPQRLSGPAEQNI